MQIAQIITDDSIKLFRFSVGLPVKSNKNKLKKKYSNIVNHLLKIAYKNSDKNKIKYENVVAASKFYSQPIDMYFNSSNTTPCVKKYNQNCVLVRKTPFNKIVRHALQSKAKISQEAFNLLHKLTELIFKQSLTRVHKRRTRSSSFKIKTNSGTQSDSSRQFHINSVDSSTQSDIISQKVSVNSGTQSDIISQKVSVDSGTQSDSKVSVDSGTHSDNISVSNTGTQSDIISQKVSVDSGTQSDSKVSVDSGTQSDSKVSVDSGTQSDNISVSNTGTQSDIISQKVSVNSGTQSDIISQKVSVDSGTQSDIISQKVSVDSGTQSDSKVSVDSGTQSDNISVSNTGTQSDIISQKVSVDSGTQSDSKVSVDSGTQSDSKVSVDSGTQSDNISVSNTGTQSDSKVSVDSGTQSDSKVSVDSGTQSDNISVSNTGTQSEVSPSVDFGTQSDSVSVDFSTQSDSESDDDDSGDNEAILSNIIIDLQSKNVDLQKAVEEERVQKELYKEMYEILESEHDKDTQSDSAEIETQTDLTHDDISDIEHDAVWQKVKSLNDRNKWKNKLLDKDLEIQSNKLQHNIEKINLQQDTDLEVLSEKLRYLSNRDKFVNDNLDYFNNMQNEINRLQNELQNTSKRQSNPTVAINTPLPETQDQSVMDIAINTPLPDTEGATDFETEVLDSAEPIETEEERWTWPETEDQTQGQSVMDIAINTPLPDTEGATDFETEVLDTPYSAEPIEPEEETWTGPEFDMETVGQSAPTRKRNAQENSSTPKRERLDSENEAIKWENELNDFLKSSAKQKAEEKVINDKKRWEKMLKKSIDESILKSKIAKADKIAFDIERNMVYSQPAQRKMQFNTINIHDKPRNEIKRAPLTNTVKKSLPLNNTIAGKVMKEKRKISLPKKFDKDQLSQTKYGQAVLRNVSKRS
jgi:hypothetical protein